MVAYTCRSTQDWKIKSIFKIYFLFDKKIKINIFNIYLFYYILNIFMLTTKQEGVLNAITEFITRYGKSPTIEELKNILEQKSKRWVVQYLESLEKKWFITRWSGFRSIRLWNGVGFQKMLSIPILGYANAGTPLDLAEEQDLWVLPVSKSVINWDENNYFILKVEGTSMNKHKIKWKTIDNGSYILVDKSDTTANSKDAFLFVVDGAATIKVQKTEWENLYLTPQSHDEYHKPIILSSSDNVTVNGKIVDVFNFE